MTRIGVCIACILALALGNAVAREQAMQEVLMETIESQRLIFHWRHEPERLATVLVYTARATSRMGRSCDDLQC